MARITLPAGTALKSEHVRAGMKITGTRLYLNAPVRQTTTFEAEEAWTSAHGHFARAGSARLELDTFGAITLDEEFSYDGYAVGDAVSGGDYAKLPLGTLVFDPDDTPEGLMMRVDSGDLAVARYISIYGVELRPGPTTRTIAYLPDEAPEA